jgi:hypothetical protein
MKGNMSENEVFGNTISGNTTSVGVVGARAIGNEVLGNLMGTSASNATDLGNSGFGVFIKAPGNFIGATASGEGNTIASNGQEGIVIDGGTSTGNLIPRYSIFSVDGLGIDFIGGPENAARPAPSSSSPTSRVTKARRSRARRTLRPTRKAVSHSPLLRRPIGIQNATATSTRAGIHL